MLPVLVVGAGPTGLTLASELARHGARPRVVEALASPSDKSKAIAVHARTLEELDLMGLAPIALERGKRLHGVNAYADGRRIVHVSFDELDSPYPFIVSLPQSETERMLLEHAASLDVRIERGVKLVALAQDDDGVTATVAREGGGEETIRAAYLVGCDGAHSTVRKAAGLAFEGSAYEEEFALADVTIDWDLADDETHAFVSPDGVIAALPLPGARRYRLVMDAPNGGDGGPPTLETFAAAMRARGSTAATLRDGGWMACFRIHRRIVPSYRAGRVLVAGDAAHIHSPVGGQGMNTGMQDAFNLGWKLALVAAGRSPSSLLDSYSIERRPIAASTLQGTDLATRVVTLRSPVAREVRNRLAAILSSVESIQQRMVRQASEIGVSYRKSPIVAEDRAPFTRAQVLGDRTTEAPTVRDWLDFGAAPAPGDRAPDAVLDADRSAPRVFDLLRHAQHTLFLFDGAASTAEGYRNLARIARAVRSRYGDRVAAHVIVPSASRREPLERDVPVVLDPEGAMHRRYGAGAECLYLVRPDGYVAYRAQPAREEALLAYLARIFVA